MTTGPGTDGKLKVHAARSRRSIFRRLLPVGIALGIAAILLWSGMTRSDAGPAMGTELNGPAPAAEHGPALMVGTFNISGCVGRSGRRDLDLTADCLREMDLAGLNEVHGLSPLQNRSQVEMIGGKLGVGWLFAPGETRWWCPNFGNGVLSRLPVTYWVRIPVACSPGRGFRNMVLVKVAHQGKTIHVLITHLDTGKDRPSQLRLTSEMFLSLAEPAILMGDLNSDRDDPQIQRLLSTPGVAEAVEATMGPKAPRRKDWLFVRGLKCLDGGLLDRQASDHPLVWGKFVIAP